MSRLGGFLIQYRYRVERGDLPELMKLLAQVEEHAHDMGLATFEVWVDDADSGGVTELHGFDSWSHWKRLADQPPESRMRPIYERLDALVVGGLAAIEASQWRPVDPAA